jgi:hypothetical protein
MARTEIVYSDNNGAMQNKEFDSFEAAWPLISRLDRQNVYYDWYEQRNGEWVDASEVTVMQDQDGEEIAAYIAGKVA